MLNDVTKYNLVIELLTVRRDKEVYLHSQRYELAAGCRDKEKDFIKRYESNLEEIENEYTQIFNIFSCKKNNLREISDDAIKNIKNYLLREYRINELIGINE